MLYYFFNFEKSDLPPFFLILDLNLINDQTEISNLFEHILTNNKFEKELEDLLIYKKALFDSNFLNEAELLKSINPLGY